MANVFVSYDRKSEGIAKSIVEDIQALGHEVWFDQKLGGGQAWWDQILGSVRRCDVFVFLLSPESLNSAACKREYGYAADLGKPILPVLVSRNVSPNLLPPALSVIQYVDYTDPSDRAAAFRLARAIGTIPPAKPLPDPLPPPPEVPISYLGALADRIETSNRLTGDEQSGLLVELKRSVRSEGTGSEAKVLLRRMRSRTDLLAVVADEIDEMLGHRGGYWANEFPPQKPAPAPLPPPPPPPPLNQSRSLVWQRVIGALAGWGFRSVCSWISNTIGAIWFADTWFIPFTKISEPARHALYFLPAICGFWAAERRRETLCVFAGGLVGWAVMGIYSNSLVEGELVGVPFGCLSGVLYGLVWKLMRRRRDQQ